MVNVATGVTDGVNVFVAVGRVPVMVGVRLGVFDGISVFVGVKVLLGVKVMVGVKVLLGVWVIVAELAATWVWADEVLAAAAVLANAVKVAISFALGGRLMGMLNKRVRDDCEAMVSGLKDGIRFAIAMIGEYCAETCTLTR